MKGFLTHFGRGLPLAVAMIAVLGFIATPPGQAQNTLPAPYQTSFETGGTNGPWDGWERSGSGPYWRRDNYGTSSSSTGPSGAHNGNYYIFLETSTGSGTAYVTNRFDVSAMTSPTAYFYYHMYGSTMGTLAFEVSTNGTSWTTLWSKTGQQHSSSSASWTQASVSLSAYNTSTDLWVRFKGVRGSSFRSDMAVDLFQLYEPGNMSLLSSYAEHTTTVSGTGTNNLQVLRVNLLTSSPTSPKDVTAMNFSTAGTTNLGDISNARVYYTGNSSNFSTSNMFGSAVAAPGGTLSYTGTQTLTLGSNYFWLVVDVSATASSGNQIDASCTNFTFDGTTTTPNPSSPSGSISIYGPLSGTYTIDPNGSGNTNFTSFSAAASILNLAGISSPVTFNVANATFNEQFVINEVSGASATNTITFDGGSNNPQITYNTTADLDYVIRLNRADYITFKNLTINNNGSEGLGIHLASSSSNNPCENITIDNCTINMSQTATDSYTAGIGAFHPNYTYYSYNFAENLLVQNCTIDGGGTGMYLRASSSSSTFYRSYGNRIHNNTIKNWNNYGVYLYYYHGGPEVIGNTVVQRSNASTNFGYGIYGYRTQNGPRFEDNIVQTKGYGIRLRYYINYYSSLSSERAKIVNNMVTVMPPTSTSSDQYGIRINRVKYIDIWHNSVNIIPPNSASNDQYGLYLDYAGSFYDQSWDVRNNLIQIDKAPDGSAGGRPRLIDNDNDYPIINFDYNVFFTYSNESQPFEFDGNRYAFSSLPMNANSKWGEAYYVTPTDLHARSHKAYLAGTNLGITDDIDGDPRGTTPCIGADEYPAPPPEYDMMVKVVQVGYATDKWAHLAGAHNHTVKAVIENMGLKDNPASLDLGFATMPMATQGDAAVVENLSPTWSGSEGLVEFATPLTGLAESPSTTLYVRSFYNNDAVGSNDQASDTHEIFGEKVHGFENFDKFEPPYMSYYPGWMDMPWTMMNNNGGEEPETAAGMGMSGTTALYFTDATMPSDEWIVTPAAALLPAASYRIGFDFENMSSVPVSMELAWGNTPNPASMTTFATFSSVGQGMYTAKDLWINSGEAGDPYFNTPPTTGMYYIGIRVVSTAAAAEWMIDNIKLDDNPSPPPKIGYAPPGSPIDDFVDDDSDPILVTANYKQPGLINKTFQVATTTNIYGYNGDMLWDVESADPWITITKEQPEPTAQGYNFTPPRPRQFQTFTMTVDPSGMSPGLHVGHLTFYAVLFNDDFPPPNQGLTATNEPLKVEVHLRIIDAGSSGTTRTTLSGTLQGPFTVPGSPYFFVDAQTGDPIVTLEVTTGQIDALTIRAFPNQLPQNLARLMYVKRYWQFDYTGSGWTANITFPYADHEASMVMDRNQLRGVRQPAPLGMWEDPINGTTSVSDPLHNAVTVNDLNEFNIMGNIALAQPYGIFMRDGDAGLPDAYSLRQNYPNPFNPATRIAYALPSESHVRIAVHNALGAEVAVLVDETQAAGRYEARFDATDLPSGLYIYRMTAGEFTQTRTMTLSK